MSKSQNNIDFSNEVFFYISVVLPSVLPDIKINLFLVMSNQYFVFSDQDGVLSFQEKKNNLQPCFSDHPLHNSTSLSYTGLGFPPATMGTSLGYFYWKTEEKWNQKKSLAV